MSCEKDCVRDCAKVVLPKNVADAIKEMRDNGVNDCGIVYYVMSDPGSSDLTDSIKEIERWVFKYGEGGVAGPAYECDSQRICSRSNAGG